MESLGSKPIQNTRNPQGTPANGKDVKQRQKPSGPNQKRHQKAAPAPELTPEEQAKALQALAEAKEKAKIEAEKVEILGKALPTMSYRQLRGTLRGFIKKGRVVAAEPAGLLDVAEAVCALALLNNTRTKENPFAKLECYLR